MTQAQAQALALMQARNQALTPEERKARSAKAAAASKAALEAKKARAAAGSTEAPRRTATVAAREDAAPAPEYAWRVLLLTDAGSVWHECVAGGMQRACRAARKANPGAMVRGALRADAPLPK